MKITTIKKYTKKDLIRKRNKHLKKIKLQNKLELKKEHERLKKICDFTIGEKVVLLWKKYKIEGIVKKINIKTYSIKTDKNYILINKESLLGYDNDLIKDISGDGRRFVNEHYKLVKYPTAKDN